MQPREFNASGQLRRVAIAGFDVEGKATYDYLKDQPDVAITILDEKPVAVPPGVAANLGKQVFDGILDFDEIWRTPGLAPRRLHTSGEVTSGTIEFFKRCPAPIIGITGSKGKGTTATLTANILERSGQTVHLVGNIGQPALRKLPVVKSRDVVVFELSSFQLWDLAASPQVAVVVMVEPDHLDVHASLSEYLTAKSNIARWQSTDDVVIFAGDNELSQKVASPGLGRKLPLMSPPAAWLKDDWLMMDNAAICSVSDFGLPGVHNHLNIAAAVTAAWQFAQDPSAAASAIKEFKGLPHRLQLIATKNKLSFVDDSISTTPSAAIAAIKAFPGPKAIILGGSDKGANFDELAVELSAQDGAKAVLVGQTAPKIQQALDKAGFKDYDRVAGGMSEIVQAAIKMLGGAGTVLLSPACASFDMFKDYQDRAEKFKKIVEDL